MSLWKNNGIGPRDTFVFYRTRPDRDGDTESYSTSAWMLLYTVLVGWLSAVLWVTIAFAYAIVVIVNAMASLL